jgi:uncharacterized protein
MKQETKRTFRCPQCRNQVEWENNPFRPFCSERCRLIDLGKWAEEEYFISGKHAPDEEPNDNN